MFPFTCSDSRRRFLCLSTNKEKDGEKKKKRKKILARRVSQTSGTSISLLEKSMIGS